MYINILKSSIKIAYNHKRTCLLGFMQFFAIYLTTKLLNNLNLVKLSFSLLLVIIISLISVVLWKYIESIKNKIPFEINIKNFLNLVIKTFLVLSFSFVTICFIKYSSLPWNYEVIIICFALLVVVYILLGIVLLKLSVLKAYLCALDFIKSKFGLFYFFYIALVLINVLGYYFSHLVINTRVLGGGFSVFMPSATIWVVFLGVALLATFFSGVINIFCVLLFLEISKIIKTPTELQTPLVPAQTS